MTPSAPIAEVRTAPRTRKSSGGAAGETVGVWLSDAKTRRAKPVREQLAALGELGLDRAA